MDDIVNFLLNYALEKNIGFIAMKKAKPDWPSVAVPEKRMIFINMNWRNQNEIPIQIAHEIGHMLTFENHISYSSGTSTIRLKSERDADVFGVKLILQYALKNDFCFTDIYSFMKQFGIPNKFGEIISKNFSEYFTK